MPPVTIDAVAAVVAALIAAPLMEIPAYAQRAAGLDVAAAQGRRA